MLLPIPHRPVRCITADTAEAADIARPSTRLAISTPRTFRKSLGRLAPGTCLDVATGRGGSAAFVSEYFPGCRLISGFDRSIRSVREAAAALGGRRIVFFGADACHPPVRPGSVDIVSIFNSLHHFEDPETVLRRASELLTPGGRLFVAEMYRDGQSGPRKTHVLMHSWWGRIDRLNGIPHFETLTRAGISKLIARAGLQVELMTDDIGARVRPASGPDLDRVTGIIDEYGGRIPADAPDRGSLLEEGERLRNRLRRNGFAPSAGLQVLLRRKPI